MRDDVGLGTVERQMDDGFAGFAGFCENLEDTEKQQLEISSTPPPNQLSPSPNQTCGGDGDRKTANPSKLASASPPPDTKPAQGNMNPTLTQSLPSTPATRPHHKKFKVGKQVPTVDSGLHHGKEGKVVDICFGSTEHDYRIALDKESHSLQGSYCYRASFSKISYPDEAVAILDPGSGAMEQS